MNLRFPIRHARNPLAGIQGMADGFRLKIAGMTEGVGLSKRGAT